MVVLEVVLESVMGSVSSKCSRDVEMDNVSLMRVMVVELVDVDTVS